MQFLTLQRKIFTDKSTEGELLVDGVFECFTLEDVCRPKKQFGVTAIPSRIYEVQITPSQRFKRDLPLLLGVPNFTSIRIHPGNTAADTEGCILVGKRELTDRIKDSRLAFDALFPKIKEALSKGKIYIEVTGGYHDVTV